MSTILRLSCQSRVAAGGESRSACLVLLPSLFVDEGCVLSELGFGQSGVNLDRAPSSAEVADTVARGVFAGTAAAGAGLGSD